MHGPLGRVAALRALVFFPAPFLAYLRGSGDDGRRGKNNKKYRSSTQLFIRIRRRRARNARRILFIRRLGVLLLRLLAGEEKTYVQEV